jgi:hypothetical protein
MEAGRLRGAKPHGEQTEADTGLNVVMRSPVSS